MATKPCSKCQTETDVLSLFPNDLCLDCYSPIGERLFRSMTAADLARMWGAPQRGR